MSITVVIDPKHILITEDERKSFVTSAPFPHMKYCEVCGGYTLHEDEDTCAFCLISEPDILNQ